jgi:hypothetical protein
MADSQRSFYQQYIEYFWHGMHKTPGKQWEIEYYYFLEWDIM